MSFRSRHKAFPDISPKDVRVNLNETQIEDQPEKMLLEFRERFSKDGTTRLLSSVHFQLVELLFVQPHSRLSFSKFLQLPVGVWIQLEMDSSLKDITWCTIAKQLSDLS